MARFRARGAGQAVPAGAVDLYKLEYLARINIFEELPQPDLEELGRRTEMRPVRRGTLILAPDQPVNALFLLKEGRVRLYRVSADGREFTLAMLGNGHVFGEIEVFSLRPRDMYAQAYEDSLLCILRRADLEHMIERRPQLALKLLHALSDRLRELEEASAHFALGTVRTRLLHLLINLAERFGTDEGDYSRLDLEITHQDLASMIGSTRETVTATLSQLSQQGVVRTGRKQITLHVGRARELVEL